MPTIGVAVAIPDPWGQQLQAYRESLGDPSASLIPTHITLVPPTELAEDGLAEVESHLADVAGERSAFRVHLRGTGTFRPVSPVVFVTLAAAASLAESSGAPCASDMFSVRVLLHGSKLNAFGLLLECCTC